MDEMERIRKQAEIDVCLKLLDKMTADDLSSNVAGQTIARVVRLSKFTVNELLRDKK